MAKTVVALFDDFASANAAVRDLVDNGFSRDDISIIASDASGEYSHYLGNQGMEGTADSGAASGAGVGAGIGAVIGGLGGLLVGLGALAIPGIGPVIAAGPLAAALTGLAGAGAGAVAGGVTGGLIGALVDMGVPDETAQVYAEGVRRGSTLVTMRADDHLADRARDILNSHNPIDVNERAVSWRESGWTRFDSAGTGAAAGVGYAGTRSDPDYVDDAERQRSLNAYREDLDNNQAASSSGSMDTTSDRWSEEQNPAASQPSSDYRSETSQESGSLTSDDYHPSSEASTTSGSEYGSSPDYSSMDTTSGYTDFSTYDANFRDHFQTSMTATGYTYEQYQPAYRYGYDLATNNRYRDRNWDDVETEARTYWEERNPGTWDRVRMAVRHAWDEIRSALS